MKYKFLIALLVFALSMPMPARADSEICRMSNGFLDGGIGGTGHYQPVSGDGIGGTGFAEPQGGDEDGIGGTGHGEDGIGGTGKRHEQKAEVIYVSGTIYAFGSVCVNGIRVTYDSSTPVSDGKNKTNANALQLGQVVQVVAEKRRGETSVRAQAIHMVHVLEGPVTHVDKARNMITVLGEPVHVTRMPAASFKEGMPVRISGLRDAAGEIVATHVAPKPNASPDTVRGAIHVTPDGKVMVNKTQLVGVGNIAAGSVVVAAGQWNGSALSVSKVNPAAEKIPAKAVYVSIEGYAADSQTVAGHTVMGAHLPHGRFIVTGAPGAGGGIVVTQVKDVPKSNTQTRDNNSGRGSNNSGSGGSSKGSHSDDSHSGHSGSDDESESSDNSGSGESGSHGGGHGSDDVSAIEPEAGDDRGSSHGDTKIEKTELAEKVETVDKVETVEKIETVEKVEKVETVEKVEKIEKVEKVETVDKVEKVEKIEKVEKVEKPEKVEKIEKIEKSEKVEKLEKPED